MRRQIFIGVLLVTVLLLLLGAFTSLFKPALAQLPPHFDVLFHFLAHVLLVLCAAQLVPPTVPPEAVCAGSIVAALFLELAQSLGVKGRGAEIADALAATVGSFAVFLVSKDGLKLQRPSLNALTAYLFGDEDEEEEDGHRVGSWAV